MQRDENEQNWCIKLPGYEKTDPEYIELNAKLTSGEILLNISATCMVYNVLIRCLTKVT